MAAAQYKAKSGTAFTDKDAEIIGHFLDVKFPEGNYTPEEIVELARPRSSPIHRYFDWDDASAAAKYRLQQARRLINCVVQIIDGVEAPKAVSVRIEDEDHLTYMNTTKAREIPDAWAQVLQDAVSGLQGWKRRYEVFSQLKKVLRPAFTAIDKVSSKFEAEREKEARAKAAKKTAAKRKKRARK